MKDIFHEIHLTVEHKNSFEEDCKTLDVKPIIIDMGSEIPTHSMTSSTLKNYSDEKAMLYAKGLQNLLELQGYVVQRLKIETVPWHKDAKSPKEGQYFEAHFAIEGDISKEDLKKNQLHKSRNLLKKDSGTVQMLTYRTYDNTGFMFSNIVDSLEITLERFLGVKVIKTIREFAIYDSNTSLDDPWLKG